MNRAVITLCVLLPFAAAAAALQIAPPEGLKRTDLQRHDLSIDGHEAIQTRVELRRVRSRRGIAIREKN